MKNKNCDCGDCSCSKRSNLLVGKKGEADWLKEPQQEP